jgi:ribosomal protein S18 acetylase RimI-like enzyme
MARDVAGYLIAYPWPLGAIPPLNSLLGSLPEDAGALYLHDLALLPEARGGGHARAVLDLLFAHALGTPIALVSVNGSTGFWGGHGFVAQESARLASYGPDARYMVRRD